jgi:hypothetical protein
MDVAGHCSAIHGVSFKILMIIILKINDARVPRIISIPR